MKHLTMLLPEEQTNLTTVACIIGTYEMFVEANAYHKEHKKKEVFRMELAGISQKRDFNSGMLTLKPHRNISEIAKTDLIIIPSVALAYEKAMTGNKKLIEWIKKQYKQGAEVASMCTGAYLLASTGLLDGRNCSTHWQAVNNFKTLYPQVNLKTERLITDENGIYTNGGGYSFLNLLIYLIEKYYSRPTAIYCSKSFQVEIDRQSQSIFAIFAGQKTHDDKMIKQAQVFIEGNLHEKLSVEELSLRYAVGRRTFDRRFKRATGNTPLEYVQRVKVEFAKKAFESTRKTVKEVMYDVGYSNVKSFRNVFRKITGVPPQEYRNKYNKEAMVGQYST